MYRSKLAAVAIVNETLNASVVADPTEPQADAKLVELNVAQTRHFDPGAVTIEVSGASVKPEEVDYDVGQANVQAVQEVGVVEIQAEQPTT